MLRRLAIVTVLLTSWMIQAHAVFAMSNYVVTPLAVQLDVASRDIQHEQVTLINHDTHLVRLYASVNEVATDGSGVVTAFKSPSEVDRTDTPTSWIAITRQRIELQPGQTKQIPFTIKMNPNTKPGKYDVFIGFAEAENAPAAQNLVMQGHTPGVLVALSVNKPQDQFLRLEGFTVSRFVTTEHGGTIRYTLHNPGSIDVVPTGDIIFYDTRGNEVGSAPLNTASTSVPAGKSVTLTMPAPTTLSLGKYKAFLSVNYGDHNTLTLNDTAYFYVVPLHRVIFAFFFVVFLAVVLALFVHRRYDLQAEDEGAERIAMYLRQGERSEDMHHDINMSSKQDS